VYNDHADQRDNSGGGRLIGRRLPQGRGGGGVHEKKKGLEPKNGDKRALFGRRGLLHKKKRRPTKEKLKISWL